MNFKWAYIQGLADSKVVRTSYVWLFIVPIAAKTLSSMDEVIRFTIFGGDIQVATRLPFSWQLLFFAACVFTAANILYSLYCPEIFRKYKSYSEFKDQGRTLLQVHSSVKNMCVIGAGPEVRKKYQGKLKGYFKHYCGWDGDIGDNLHKEAMSQFDNVSKSSNANVTNNAFYFSQEVANKYNWGAILTALVLYGIGLALVTIIAVQNILFVAATMSG